MRIWMEDHYGEKDHFALKTTLYLLLLLAFAIMIPVVVTWLALYFKWPITEVTLTTCIVDVILVVWLARECGAQGAQILHGFLPGRQRRSVCSRYREICRIQQGTDRIHCHAAQHAASCKKHERETCFGAVHG